MKAIKMPAKLKLMPQDRAELCRRVNLPDLLQGDGIDVKRKGKDYVCCLRDERTPSCYLYPPGVGLKGVEGWTLYDFGDSWHGDAISYLMDKRGMRFRDAVQELCRRTGYWPDGWAQGDGPPPRPAPPPRPLAPPMPLMHPATQRKAARIFLDALVDLSPDAAKQGKAHLATRGCLPKFYPYAAYGLTNTLCKKLAAKLARTPEADLLTRAGLLKIAEEGKPPSLAWWDAVCLLACSNTRGRPVYFVGRRLDWKDGDKYGKYINQGCSGGAERLPYNLPALYHAAGKLPGWPVKPAPDKAGELLLVEGAMDALGAAVLGWLAVALLTRLQAHDTNRMLEHHLQALRAVRRVRVVPDADRGEKGAQGISMAESLVDWLRKAGVKAELATLTDLNAPDGCKDLAEWAKNR